MFNLRQLLGGRPTVATKLPLTPQAADLLWQDFKKLERHQAGIAERLFRYALTGEDEVAALNALANIPEAGDKLGLICPNNRGGWHGMDEKQKERRAFFSEASGGDALFYLRLARIYEAAAGGTPTFHPKDDFMPALSLWLPPAGRSFDCAPAALRSG